MNRKKYKVSFEESVYINVFYVDALLDFDKSEIFKALKKISYGDGDFYLSSYGQAKCRIEFHTYDPFYGTAEFAEKHAVEISNALSELAKSKYALQ
jgi:hypothetical protein